MRRSAVVVVLATILVWSVASAAAQGIISTQAPTFGNNSVGRSSSSFSTSGPSGQTTNSTGVTTGQVTPPAQATATNSTGQCGSPLQVLQQQQGVNLQLILGFLQTANLVNAFSDSTAMATLFIPTDEAIRSGITQMGMTLQAVQQNAGLLRDLIFYFVVPVTDGGSRLSAAQLTNGLTLQSSLTQPGVLTCGERSIRISNQGGTVRALGGGSSGTVIRPDLQSCNAFVHIIDGLIVPCPLNTPTQRAPNQPVVNQQASNVTTTANRVNTAIGANIGNVTAQLISPSPAPIAVQPVAQPVVQPVGQVVGQPIGQVAGQSIGQIAGQNLGQIPGLPLAQFGGQPIIPPIGSALGQIAGQPIVQPIGQPIAGQAGAFQLAFGDASSRSEATSNGVAEAQADATAPRGAFAEAFSQGGQAARSTSRATGVQRAVARSVANAGG